MGFNHLNDEERCQLGSKLYKTKGIEMMKKTPIAALIMASLLLTSSLAHADSQPNLPTQERDHNEELVGFGTGALLGAVVGGPVGAVIGAFTGGIVGKSVGDDEQLKSQQQQLAEQTEQLASLSEKQRALKELSLQYADAQSRLNALSRDRAAQLEELIVGMNVQFRTGTAEIEPHFARQLDDLAYAMSLSPELMLDLTGYADRRGNSDYNQTLSEQRVEAVKSYLVSQGVAEERLQTQAFGASSPLSAKQSRESDFFDRRVTLKLQTQGAALAANQQSGN